MAKVAVERAAGLGPLDFAAKIVAGLCLLFAATASVGQSAQQQPAGLVTGTPTAEFFRGLHEDQNRLMYLSTYELSAGHMEEAERLAWELLENAKAFHALDPWLAGSGYAQSKHYGNVILGHIMLQLGYVETAKEHLLDAARVPGSPTLGSFGPDMLLAKELLERGERRAVLEYLELCAVFWTNEKSPLRQWTAEVRRGGIPDFDANLRYIFKHYRFAVPPS
jgi:hypothetical protein